MKFINIFFFASFLIIINSNITGMNRPLPDPSPKSLLNAIYKKEDLKRTENLLKNIDPNKYINYEELSDYIKKQMPLKSTNINAFSLAIILYSIMTKESLIEETVSNMNSIIKTLINSKKVNINAESHEGYTALMFATLFNGIDAVKLLLDHEANPNLQNKDGNTALHLATLKEYNDIVEFLIRHGAQKNIENNKGETPQYLATISGNNELIKIYENTVEEPKKPATTPSEDSLVNDVSNLAHSLSALSTTLH